MLRVVREAATNVEQRTDGILGARRDELLTIRTETAALGCGHAGFERLIAGAG
jgi:hypothetical protein